MAGIPLSFELVIFLELVLASLLGGILGAERGRKGSAAGLRTHLLVALGSAAFMEMSRWIPTAIPPTLLGGDHPSDPARLAAQIIPGIGFLGAGAILRDGLTIKGLTTAATLWVAASIGMAAGGGFILISLMITGIALTALFAEEYLDHGRRQERVLILHVPMSASVEHIKKIISNMNLSVVRYDYKIDMVKNEATLTLIVLPPSNSHGPDHQGEDLVKEFLKSGEQLISLEWSHRVD